jgi:hypothetical protein
MQDFPTFGLSNSKYTFNFHQDLIQKKKKTFRLESSKMLPQAIIGTLALALTASAQTLTSCSGLHGLNGYEGNTFTVVVDNIDSDAIGSVCGSCSKTIGSAAGSQGVHFDSDSCQTSGSRMSAVIQLNKQSPQTEGSVIITGLASCLGNDFNQNGVTCSCSGC